MPDGPSTVRQRRGRRAERSGRAAEATVRRCYEANGGKVVAERWRRREGEIDLIVQMPSALVFVEVKSGLYAAHAIGERQWSRLEAAATRYMLEHTTGDEVVRFDVALVAPDGTVEIIENARVN
jgi:putative endonuclease